MCSMWMSPTQEMLSLSSDRYAMHLFSVPLHLAHMNVLCGIAQMQVRGAPLIAIVAALGLAVDVRAKQATFSSVQEAESFLLASMETLRSSRPTAVNLFVAMDELGCGC